MTYEDIINDNCKNCSKVKWWPKFAFHFTDVCNAVSILGCGNIFSRLRAVEKHVMKNENASRQVINMTEPDVMEQVRFYFRPQTPTQYYNEGYKHPSLRYDHDASANIPLPVFFLFDMNTLLQMDQTTFSETSQAGKGGPTYKGIEKFQSLPFNKIYSTGYCEDFKELIPYRHAELLYPDQFPIDQALCTVLCRNNAERMTLLNLLYRKHPKSFWKYRNIIKAYTENTFYENGLFISSVEYHNLWLNIAFADNQAQQRYIECMKYKNNMNELTPIFVTIHLQWTDGMRKNLLFQTNIPVAVNIESTHDIPIKLVAVPSAKYLHVRVIFENYLMNDTEIELEQNDVF